MKMHKTKGLGLTTKEPIYVSSKVNSKLINKPNNQSILNNFCKYLTNNNVG